MTRIVHAPTEHTACTPPALSTSSLLAMSPSATATFAASAPRSARHHADTIRGKVFRLGAGRHSRNGDIPCASSAGRCMGGLSCACWAPWQGQATCLPVSSSRQRSGWGRAIVRIREHPAPSNHGDCPHIAGRNARRRVAQLSACRQARWASLRECWCGHQALSRERFNRGEI